MGLEAVVEATTEFLNKAIKQLMIGGPKMRMAKDIFGSEIMPQSNALLDCSPVSAAGHVIPKSYIPVSVSQFMDDLYVEGPTIKETDPLRDEKVGREESEIEC
ncbi:hypothetical protein AgCh_012298 [Apium graveolens]